MWKVILAAGASSRMGFPKALLRLGDCLLLEAHVRSPAGVVGHVVVLGGNAELIRATCDLCGAHVCLNHRWSATGLTHSLAEGLRALPEGVSALVTPVDCPPPPAVVIETLREGGGPALARVPTYQGRRGHPLWLSPEAISLFMASDPPDRLDGWIAALPGVVEVPVEHAGVLVNLNTPEDVATYLGTPGAGRLFG